jgi:hypothetical protein
MIPWGFLFRLAAPFFALGLAFVFGFSVGQAQEQRKCDNHVIVQPTKGK